MDGARAYNRVLFRSSNCTDGSGDTGPEAGGARQSDAMRGGARRAPTRKVGGPNVRELYMHYIVG